MPSAPHSFVKLAPRAILVAILPWLPAYLFERIDFWFGITGNGTWYYNLSGFRLEADVVSFALGGVLLAFLLRPRWALLQVFLSAILIWVLFYVTCGPFRMNGLLHSDCYQTGPDGLAGFRLSLMMFCFGALPPLVKAADKRDRLSPKTRPLLALFAGFVETGVMTWFPLSAWFSGVTYLPPFPLFQAAIVAGIPLLITGMLTARISRSLWIPTIAGIFSLLCFTGVFWTLLCPSCQRELLLPTAPFWALFAFLGALLELGLPGRRILWKNPFKTFGLNDLRLIVTAAVIIICLWATLAYAFWSPSVLYANPISPGPGQPTLGLPSYPYVAGFYNSTQYRICCLEIARQLRQSQPFTPST